jgi:D-arabinose 1-dehydrogenase-like Zn-dependent alcohol dehydrogenase
MAKILVVDGQGGGLGRALVEKLKSAGLEVTAAGTNAAATDAMRKAGADAVATGESAIVYNAARADIIAGGVGIIAANSMLGEISPAIAAAISGSDAMKVLIPIHRCRVRIAGVSDLSLTVNLESALNEIKNLYSQGDPT